MKGVWLLFLISIAITCSVGKLDTNSIKRASSALASPPFTWYQTHPSGDLPRKPSVFPLWMSLSSSNIYYYGTDFNETGDTDDMYIYSTSLNSWIRLDDTQLIDFIKPTARMSASVWQSSGTSLMMACGGIYSDDTFSSVRKIFNDIWKFDAFDYSWKQITPIGDKFPNEGLIGATAIVMGNGNDVYIFGGRTLISDPATGKKVLKEVAQLYLYKINENILLMKNPTEDATEDDDADVIPCARRNAIMIPTTEGFIITGGYSEERGYLSDTWIYEATNDAWKQIVSYPNLLSNNPQKGFYGNTGYVDGSIYYTYGGYNTIKGSLKKTLTYDILRKGWKTLKTNGAPPGFMCHSTTGDHSNIYIYGGYALNELTDYKIVYMDSPWRFSLSPQQQTFSDTSPSNTLSSIQNKRKRKR